jgi:hypothetical protein
MDALESLRYLREHHKQIAIAFNHGSGLAKEIMRALDEQRPPAAFVPLAEQWKAGAK